MANLGKVLSRLGAKKVKKMDDAAKRMAGLPGYDDDTLSLIEEYAKKEEAGITRGKLPSAEEREADRKAIRKMMQKEKESKLTAAEERAYDRMMAKRVREGGAETEAGMAKKEKAQKLTAKEREEMQKSLEYKKGGMVKGYAKGGMAKANCGASVKPNGGSRNK